jgi:DNA primase
MIPQSFIQELLHRVDIVDVIDRHVKLKRAGANFSACCPFHSEKSPSFTVSPTKQFYHCFGCGAHGTAVGFLMEYSGLGFVDAVKELAQGIGLTVPEERSHEPQRRRNESEDGEDLHAVMLKAAQFYRGALKDAPQAIEYLKRRGLSGEIAKKFGVGYAPEGWQNLERAFPQYQSSALTLAGLVKQNDEGRRYDVFRDRIMFPIVDVRGNVIGFGGRVLDKGEPKYLNSPETPLFEKGRELYGLYQARRAIRDAGRVIVVEGYMDVVALAQHGVEYAVATLGTATTPAHVQKLLRQTDEIVYCFDGDSAGRRAAWRALENSLGQLADDKQLRFLFLPQGEDPDTYVRQHGSGHVGRPRAPVARGQAAGEADRRAHAVAAVAQAARDPRRGDTAGTRCRVSNQKQCKVRCATGETSRRCQSAHAPADMPAWQSDAMWQDIR